MKTIRYIEYQANGCDFTFAKLKYIVPHYFDVFAAMVKYGGGDNVE